MKKFIPKSIKKLLKRAATLARNAFDLIKRKKRLIGRKLTKNTSGSGYSFAILTTNKKEYVDMAIQNINSLHYLNPRHSVTLYCDTLCYEYLLQRKNKLDYPHKVIIKDAYGKNHKPWQYYKVETLIEASKNSQILTDADGIWHEDPEIDTEKITLLVIANKIQEKEEERRLVEEVLENKEWVKFNHYVTGFVFIPSRFMTEKIMEDLRSLNDYIFNNGNGLKRLSEELAVNLALQSNYSTEYFRTLKIEDGPRSKVSLESLYYGCLNQIEE